MEFDPAIADCGYRAPLVPHLARPHTNGTQVDQERQEKKLAERAGFEPAKEGHSLRDFQSRALGQLRYLSADI